MFDDLNSDKQDNSSGESKTVFQHPCDLPNGADPNSDEPESESGRVLGGERGGVGAFGATDVQLGPCE